MNAIDRIVVDLRRLETLDPAAIKGVELIVRDAVAMRARPSPRTLDARLRREHPGCDAGFLQQPPHSGRRSWRCDRCGAIVTLPGGAH
jgi:hypothetical protein